MMLEWKVHLDLKVGERGSGLSHLGYFLESELLHLQNENNKFITLVTYTINTKPCVSLLRVVVKIK